MSAFAPASWIAIFVAIGGGLIAVFMSRRGR